MDVEHERAVHWGCLAVLLAWLIGIGIVFGIGIAIVVAVGAERMWNG